MKCQNCEKDVWAKGLCKKHSLAQWRNANRARYRELQRVCYYKHAEERKFKVLQNYKKNRDARIAGMRALYRKQRDQRLTYESARRQANPALVTAYSKLRNQRLVQATPKWMTDAQIREMIQIYRGRPPGMEVDHIVPIHGKTVCGLHVPWNLQYLSAEDNRRKRNKLNLC